MSSRPKEEISVSGVDDVVMVLKSDYENAYFVTGIHVALVLFPSLLSFFIPFSYMIRSVPDLDLG